MIESKTGGYTMSVCKFHFESINGIVNELWPFDGRLKCSCVGVHAHVLASRLASFGMFRSRLAVRWGLYIEKLGLICTKQCDNASFEFWSQIEFIRTGAGAVSSKSCLCM